MASTSAATAATSGGYVSAARSLLGSRSLLDGSVSSSRSRTTSEADSLSSSTSSSAAGQQRKLVTHHNDTSSDPANTCRVFLYTREDWCGTPVEDFHELFEGDTAETVCHSLCKRLKFKPVVELLFALRNVQDNCFVPACRPLVPKMQYEFRLRFKMPDHTKLQELDKNAFVYYYMQVRYDLINLKYPGINYQDDEGLILGLVVADMYLEMTKYNTSADQLCKQYKKFVPKPLQKVGKKKIRETISTVVKKDYDQYYIMESYLSQINTVGPFYMLEEYHAEGDSPAAEAKNLDTVNSVSTTSVAASTSSAGSTRELLHRGRKLIPHLTAKPTKCALKIVLCPEYKKEPVLNVHYKHTGSVSAVVGCKFNHPVVVVVVGRTSSNWEDFTGDPRRQVIKSCFALFTFHVISQATTGRPRARQRRDAYCGCSCIFDKGIVLG